jgi:pilus assembly protein CpaB
MSKRLFGVIIALALAAVGTAVIVGYVDRAEERATADEARVPVLVVDEPIDRGATIEEVERAVRTVLVPAKVQAAGSMETLSDVEGLVAAVDLIPGEQVLSTRFVAPQVLETETAVQVPDGLLQVTVSLTPERALGGSLRPGSTVAVVASFEPFELGGASEPSEFGVIPTEEKTPNTTHIILHKVLVTKMQVEELPTGSGSAGESANDSGVGLAPTGNLLVTLAVTAAEMEKIVFSQEHGAVWLAHEPLNASEAGTQIQTRGSIYE